MCVCIHIYIVCLFHAWFVCESMCLCAYLNFFATLHFLIYFLWCVRLFVASICCGILIEVFSTSAGKPEIALRYALEFAREN